MKPPSRGDENWPKCSFFGVYDGHGGSACADYLRDNLHQFVIRESSFPWNPREALRKGFDNAERKFLELAQDANGITERSGSCAVVTLIVGDMCYVANVGDSRALLSGYYQLYDAPNREGGNRVYALTRDHKPIDELERKRIIEAGGQIYQTATPAALLKAGAEQQEMIVGPHRVLPGRLSVCRTFGDAEAKLSKYGGNPDVVIATPEIKSFKIADNHDFIVMGSDGIFDKLTNKETVQCVWNSVKTDRTCKIHQQCGIAVDTVLKNSLFRRSLDNVTTLMIGFGNFKRHFLTFTTTLKQPSEKTLPKEAKWNDENVQRNGNRPESEVRIKAGEKGVKVSQETKKVEPVKKAQLRGEPTVMSKIVASSTRAMGQKHFDFGGRAEMLEGKKAYMH